jgi:HlyD family secretion protein
MKPPPRPVIALALVLAVGTAAWLVWRPSEGEAGVLAGYVEGDSLLLSAPVAGIVAEVRVERGQRVAAGAPLFVMDARGVGAQQAEARAGVAQGRTQVEAAQAAWRQALANAEAARAQAANARSIADRYAALRRANPGALAALDLDRVEAEARVGAAQAEAAFRQANAARAQIDSAMAAVDRAGAGVNEIGVRLDLLSPRAPASGRVEEVYFQPGEWAPANRPVVSLLPDDRIKLRFFVPERSVALYRPGRGLRFRCDGCGAERTAAVVYVSPRAEFTPPVIYSRENRDRLVFMVEARPANPADLAPGLPIEVTPLGAGGRP